ncbi:MAG TPA: Ig-like domain-containing protein, partial [Armatimonadota bacterium]|nr:Ig-like domain-containing protein [Armatimonadota bacterium]
DTDTTTVTFTHVPVGEVTVTSTAYPENGGQGVAMAKGTVTQTAQADAPLHLTLTMNTTIDWLFATPSYAMVSVGRTLQLEAGAMNLRAGEVVLINKDRVEWTSNTPSIATIDEHTGLVTGIAVGTASMHIKDTESGVGSDFTVTVSELSGSLYWGSLGSQPSQFDRLKGIAVDSSGDVYVADTGNHRIQKFSSQGTYLCSYGSQGSGQNQFEWPSESLQPVQNSMGNKISNPKHSTKLLILPPVFRVVLLCILKNFIVYQVIPL